MKICYNCKYESPNESVCGRCRRKLIRPDWIGRTEEERFKSLMEVAPTGCWLWKGAKDERGYGAFYLRRKRWLAHRAAWALFRGEPLKQICHSCDTPACVNPDHLYEADQSKNLRDMIARGRRRYVLTEEMVIKAKSLRRAGMEYREIAALLGVGHSGIWLACTGKTWRHL